MKPQITEPLVIGVWHVYVVLDSKVIAKLNFLVTPLTHWRNRPISHEKSREFNRGPSSAYHVTKDATDKWIEFLKPYANERMAREMSRLDDEVRTYFICNLVCSNTLYSNY